MSKSFKNDKNPYFNFTLINIQFPVPVITISTILLFY